MIGLDANQGAHFAEAVAAAGFHAGVGDFRAEFHLGVVQMLGELQHFGVDLIGSACKTSGAAADENLTFLTPQPHFTFLTEVAQVVSGLQFHASFPLNSLITARILSGDIWG